MSGNIGVVSPRLLVFGGRDGRGIVDIVAWALDVAAGVWTVRL